MEMKEFTKNSNDFAVNFFELSSTQKSFFGELSSSRSNLWVVIKQINIKFNFYGGFVTS